MKRDRNDGGEQIGWEGLGLRGGRGCGMGRGAMRKVES
jgi:hypothetical protein